MANPDRALATGLSAVAIALVAAGGPAWGHPGHDEAGANAVLAGLAHPFSGLDHLLVAVLLGLAAGQQSGTARWVLPALFLAALPVGLAVGAPAALQVGLAVTGLAGLGVCLATAASGGAPIVGGLALIGGLAVGLPHAPVAAGSGAPVAFSLSFVAGTAALVATGLLVARLAAGWPTALARSGAAAAGLGAVVALAGIV